MSETVQKGLLLAIALFFLFTAWASGTDPDRFAEQLGLSLLGPSGANEIRAQYSGFFLACALACIAALWGQAPRPAVFLLLAILFGGLIGGRIFSLMLNGGLAGFGPTILALYAIDGVGFVLAVTALATPSAGRSSST